MGFSVSGSAAIVFIAAFVSVGILYTAAYNGYEEVTVAEDDQADRLLQQRNTDVAIVGTAYNTSTDNFTVEIMNEGSTTLSVSETDVVLDGAYQPAWASYNVSGSTTTDVWAPGESLNVTISTGTDTEPSRVKVVTGTGVSVTEAV